MTANRRGFTLIETVVSLIILANLAVLGTELLRTSFRVMNQSVASQELVTRLNSAIGQLRVDAWNAKSFSSTNDQSLHIETGQGAAVDWSVDAGDLIRRAANGQRRWIGVGSDSLFQTNGPSAVFCSKSHVEGEQIRLVSQLQLARQLATPEDR